MMVFTIRDSKVEAYLPPFLAANVPTAQRLLQDAVRGGDSMLQMHPEDYQLFHVGMFDEQTGELSSVKHTAHGKIVDFIEVKNEGT